MLMAYRCTAASTCLPVVQPSRAGCLPCHICVRLLPLRQSRLPNGLLQPICLHECPICPCWLRLSSRAASPRGFFGTAASHLPARMSNLPVLIAPLLQGRLPQGQLPHGLLRQGAGEHHAGRLGRVPRSLPAVQREHALFYMLFSLSSILEYVWGRFPYFDDPALGGPSASCLQSPLPLRLCMQSQRLYYLAEKVGDDSMLTGSLPLTSLASGLHMLAVPVLPGREGGGRLCADRHSRGAPLRFAGALHRGRPCKCCLWGWPCFTCRLQRSAACRQSPLRERPCTG